MHAHTHVHAQKTEATLKLERLKQVRGRAVQPHREVRLLLNGKGGKSSFSLSRQS